MITRIYFNINEIIESTVIHLRWFKYFLIVSFSLHFFFAFTIAYLSLKSDIFAFTIPFTFSPFQIAAFSDGYIKVYELMDPLDLKSWQLQVINLLIFFQIV